MASFLTRPDKTGPVKMEVPSMLDETEATEGREPIPELLNLLREPDTASENIPEIFNQSENSEKPTENIPESMAQTKTPDKSAESPYRPIQCEHCHANFSSKKVYNRHVKEVHLKLRIPCPKCHKPFSRLTRMKKHTEKCEGTGTNCHMCRQEFNSEELLRFHVQQMHDIQFYEGKSNQESNNGESAKTTVIIEPENPADDSINSTPTAEKQAKTNGTPKQRKRKLKEAEEPEDHSQMNGIDAFSNPLIARLTSLKSDEDDLTNLNDLPETHEAINGVAIKRRRQSSLEDGDLPAPDLDNPLHPNGLIDNPLLQLISRGIDEAESFALSLVPTFRQLPKEKLQLAKIQINQLLFDLAYGDKLKDLNR